MKPFIRRLLAGLQQIWQTIRGFRRYFSRAERGVILGLLLIALGSMGFWVRDALVRSGRVSAGNMVYSEGWVIKDPKVTLDFGRLTRAGLTRFDAAGQVVGDMAESWEESADRQTYTFHIRPSIQASQLMGYISQDKSVYGGAEASAPDEQTLVLQLKQPLNYFLNITTHSVYPYGPYRLERQTANAVTLVAARDYHLGRPKIGRVVIRLYKNQNELSKAVAKKQVLATADLTSEIPDLKVQRVALPRFVSLFLNIARPPFSDKETRRKLVQGENLADKHLKITLASNSVPEVDRELQGVLDKFSQQGVEVTVTKQDSLTIVQDTIARRDYDALLFGIDYGYGEDLYPFWHSSQATSSGSNFVGLQNKTLDKKLEEARTTNDQGKRKELVDQIKNIIKDEFVEMPIREEMLIYQSSNNVGGNEIAKLFDPLDRFSNIIAWTTTGK